MRSKKAFKNTMWGFVYAAVVLICGFILPRLILTSFGSSYNGITSTIAQFLEVISLFQAGIGAVTMAALYRPLAQNDINQISIIMKTTERYMRKIALIFVGFSILIACTLPFIIKEFDYLFTASLVIIMSFSTFVQYFFGLTYQFLLSADQMNRFMHIVNAVKVIANTVISAILIKAGFGIHGVKLGAMVVFVIAPIFVYVHVRKKYKLINDVRPDNNTINQRWDNFGIQVADFVSMNTDLVLISIFSDMKIASVYTIYSMVIKGVFGLFTPFVQGVGSAFGNMLVKNETDLLKKNLRLYEQVVFGLSTFLFGVAAAMILSFVGIYTKKIFDVNYFQPVFAYVFILAIYFKAIRYPYGGLIVVAGHFKQNRNLAFVEAGMNIVLSATLIIKFGLAGVVIGTLCAAIFRTIRYAIYASTNLVPRSNWLFVRRLALSLTVLAVIAILPYILSLTNPSGYVEWVLYAVIISSVAIILIFLTELIFYRKDLGNLSKMLMGIFSKHNPKRRTNPNIS